MTEIKPGIVAVIKTTEEPVFVLFGSVDAETQAQIFTVRRPVATEKDGIKHVREDFFEAELLAKDDFQEQQIQQLMGTRARFNAEKSKEDPTQATLPFKLN